MTVAGDIEEIERRLVNIEINLCQYVILDVIKQDVLKTTSSKAVVVV